MRKTPHPAYNYWYGILFLGLILAGGAYSSGSLTGYQLAPPSTTPLNNAIEFLRAFGFFNVILPFLLVFAFVFGILEKTRLFGTEKIKGEDYSRKNLNSIVAFCIAFFVVAASNIVGIIQNTLPQVTLALVFILVFLLLFGSLMGAETLKKGGGILDLWAIAPGINKFFIFLIFAVMLFILLGAFGWLAPLLGYVGANIGGTFLTSIILVIVFVFAMWWMAKSSPSSGKKD